MKTFEIGFGNSYPHYYTLKGSDRTFNDDNTIEGIGEITGSYSNDNPVSVGDIIDINGVKHVIDGFIGKREPKGKHNKLVTWFRANTSYVRRAPNS